MLCCAAQTSFSKQGNPGKRFLIKYKVSCPEILPGRIPSLWGEIKSLSNFETIWKLRLFFIKYKPQILSGCFNCCSVICYLIHAISMCSWSNRGCSFVSPGRAWKVPHPYQIPWLKSGTGLEGQERWTIPEHLLKLRMHKGRIQTLKIPFRLKLVHIWWEIKPLLGQDFMEFHCTVPT